VDEASAGTAMRIVIENPALGRRVVTTVFLRRWRVRTRILALRECEVPIRSL
jgi:hypothetical protein